MAGRAFASLCTDGSMLGVRLDGEGNQASTSRTDVFFDANNDPVMEKPALIDGVAYFPTFLGRVIPVDLSGDSPEVGDEWSLIGEGDEGWRPGGLQVTGADAAGRLYVLMHPEGYEGSHKDPGIEIWVFDVESRSRIDRIALELPAITFGLTNDDAPLLITTNINLEVDVYDIGSGDYLRTLSGTGAQTPFLIHGTH